MNPDFHLLKIVSLITSRLSSLTASLAWAYAPGYLLRNCYLILLFSVSTSVLGQDQMRGWEWQNPLPQGNSLNAIRFADDKRHGWAVGSDGAILRTVNGGFGWETQKSSANTTLYGLYVKDRSRVFISGARGVVLTSVAGGGKWVP
jgi:hypothetical protein